MITLGVGDEPNNGVGDCLEDSLEADTDDIRVVEATCLGTEAWNPSKKTFDGGVCNPCCF